MGGEQFAVSSSFGAATVASDALRGIDLSYQIAVVTEGHSGLGLETTRALAQAGAQVIVTAKDAMAAYLNVRDISNVTVAQLDLSNFGSIRDFAARHLATCRHIDILIANAEVMACPEIRVDLGLEAHFATNHLGHYALVNLLWPALRGSARVIVVSSANHHQSGIRWGDVQFRKRYDKWLAYAQSKTANVLFAVHLDRLGLREGVRAFSVNPGKTLAHLQWPLFREDRVGSNRKYLNHQYSHPIIKTASQGAATQLWAATSLLLTGLGGLYCEDCGIARQTMDEPPSGRGVRGYAIDLVEARRLWALSAELTGVNTICMLQSIRYP